MKNYIWIILITLITVLFLILALDWKELLLQPVSFPDVDTQSNKHPNPNNQFEERIWLHRVNDYVRMVDAASDDYKGIEIDVHYSLTDDEFYVTHDPNPEELLNLEDLLSSESDIDDYYIWLDFKNLEDYNYQKALKRLIDIKQKLQIPSFNIIVESDNPYYLYDYTMHGFNTSYYLPAFNPYDASDREIVQYALTIDSVLMKSKVTYISGNYKQYHFIKKYFPDAEVLLWQTHRNLLAPYLRDKILDDPNVKVLLVR